MGQALQVRSYVSSDFPRIMEIWEETGISSPGRGDTAEMIDKTLAHGGHFLILEDRSTSRILGTSWITHDGRRLYLHHFAITKSHQNQGLAKNLLQPSLAIAKALGLQIKLEVHTTNAAAIHLYKKAGFQRLGDYDVYIIRNLDQI